MYVCIYLCVCVCTCILQTYGINRVYYTYTRVYAQHARLQTRLE